MRINTMKEKKAYWQLMLATQSAEEIEKALLSMPVPISTVLQYHYLMKYSFKEIVGVMQLSITTIRNHHNRGIYLLAKHFGDYKINT